MVSPARPHTVALVLGAAVWAAGPPVAADEGSAGIFVRADSDRTVVITPRDRLSFTLFLATVLGIPVSTTHTITGAIVGVGSAHGVSAVRWGVAGNIVLAWLLTIPCSAFMAAVAWWLGTHFL